MRSPTKAGKPIPHSPSTKPARSPKCARQAPPRSTTATKAATSPKSPSMILAASALRPKKWPNGNNSSHTHAIPSTFGGSGSGAGQLSAPGGVATDSEGNVWVADTGHNRVQEFNSKGEFVRQFGATGSGNGLFAEPRGIAIDSKGNVWVADTGNNRVQEFNPKGEYLASSAASGTGNGQFKIAAGRRGRLRRQRLGRRHRPTTASRSSPPKAST